MDKIFRSIPDKWFTLEVFNNPVNPLIIVSRDAFTTYYNKADDKQNALRATVEEDLVLFVWQWKWRSDVFEMTRKDIANLLLPETEDIPF